MEKECAASASEAVALLKIWHSLIGPSRTDSTTPLRDLWSADAGRACRDERQVVKALAEFRSHASCSNGYEPNSNDGARNLQMAVVGSIAWEQAFRENGDRWRGD